MREGVDEEPLEDCHDLELQIATDPQSEAALDIKLRRKESPQIPDKNRLDGGAALMLTVGRNYCFPLHEWTSFKTAFARIIVLPVFNAAIRPGQHPFQCLYGL